MTTEQMDAVNTHEDELAEEPVPPNARPPAPKRPATSDHKPKAKKKAKPKVKTVTKKDEKGDDVLDENGHTIPIGREVTLHGVTVTVLDSALGDFETTDDLSLMGEAFEASKRDGENADEELLQAASSRVSPLLRRIVGIAGSREVLTALKYENGGRVEFGHAVEFVGELIEALSPNS